MKITSNLSAITPMHRIDEITELLLECGLPVSDISPHRHRFFGIHCENNLVAVAGLEPLGSVGLIRSLAVDPTYRHLGLARQLVLHVERIAAGEGISALYLLTTTASSFFMKLGYRHLLRTEAPDAVRSSTQFSELCPTSSDFLCKKLEPGTSLSSFAEPS